MADTQWKLFLDYCDLHSFLLDCLHNLLNAWRSAVLLLLLCNRFMYVLLFYYSHCNDPELGQEASHWNGQRRAVTVTDAGGANNNNNKDSIVDPWLRFSYAIESSLKQGTQAECV